MVRLQLHDHSVDKLRQCVLNGMSSTTCIADRAEVAGELLVACRDPPPKLVCSACMGAVVDLHKAAISLEANMHPMLLHHQPPMVMCNQWCTEQCGLTPEPLTHTTRAAQLLLSHYIVHGMFSNKTSAKLVAYHVTELAGTRRSNKHKNTFLVFASACQNTSSSPPVNTHQTNTLIALIT